MNTATKLPQTSCNVDLLGSSKRVCAYLGHLYGAHQTNQRTRRYFQLDWADRFVPFHLVRSWQRDYVYPARLRVQPPGCQLSLSMLQLEASRMVVLPHLVDLAFP